MKEKEELSHFIKAMKMGIEIFSQFRKKTNDLVVAKEIDATIDQYNFRLDELLTEYRNSYSKDSDPEITFMQKRAIMMVKMELMCKKTSRSLVRFIAKSTAMGAMGAYKFLDKVSYSSYERVIMYKNAIADFNTTYQKFTKLLLKLN